MEAENVRYLVVHCSATYAHMDIGAKEIDSWHKSNGWAGIGYHFVIRRSGIVEPGRPLDQALAPGWQVRQGAHVSGYNSQSVGVCLVGGLDSEGKPKPNFTHDQWKSLITVVDFLKLCFPRAEVLGHRDLDPGKACPCFNVRKWVETGGIVVEK